MALGSLRIIRSLTTLFHARYTLLESQCRLRKYMEWHLHIVVADDGSNLYTGIHQSHNASLNTNTQIQSQPILSIRP